MVTRKKKLYLAIIALGGLAMFVDRALLSSATTLPAGADAALIGMGHTAASDADSDDYTTLPIPELPFPRGLTPFNPQLPIRDIFAPPGFDPNSANNGSARKLDGSSTNSDADPQRLSRVAFDARYQLDGVLVRGGLKIAIVNGTWLNVKQVLGGCTLADVEGNRAVFECHDGSIVLEVEKRVIR